MLQGDEESLAVIKGGQRDTGGSIHAAHNNLPPPSTILAFNSILLLLLIVLLILAHSLQNPPPRMCGIFIHLLVIAQYILQLAGMRDVITLCDGWPCHHSVAPLL
jgi:tellurite resistance protein TehA-like permease